MGRVCTRDLIASGDVSCNDGSKSAEEIAVSCSPFAETKTGFVDTNPGNQKLRFPVETGVSNLT